MLTRLEVDGFKNLLDFEADFGPFTCLAGPNGVGKSNIFDVIQFLSLLADQTLMEAALSLRGADSETADPLALFWTDGKARADHLSIAAEMIVERKVTDDFGRHAEASSTYLRYEIQIKYEPSEREGELGRLVLHHESLGYITEGRAASRLGFPHSAGRFRRRAVKNTRRSKSKDYISTEVAADGQREILVAQDGGRRGPPAKAPAEGAPKTVVATSNTSTTPTILAARREMQSWKVLSLEPTAMRQVDSFQADRNVSAVGGHLPAALYRLAGREDDEAHLYARVAGRLAELVPVRDVRVAVDNVRRLLTLEIQENSGMWLPARSLSDGTLRFLALCILHEDPDFRGVICMEEPENGIHPEKIPAMFELLRDLAVDAEEDHGAENPLRQMIVATHSPHLVQHLWTHAREDLLFATSARVKSQSGRPVSVLRCRPAEDTWRVRSGVGAVGLGTILAYLTLPEGSQIELPHVA